MRRGIEKWESVGYPDEQKIGIFETPKPIGYLPMGGHSKPGSTHKSEAMACPRQSFPRPDRTVADATPKFGTILNDAWPEMRNVRSVTALRELISTRGTSGGPAVSDDASNRSSSHPVSICCCQSWSLSWEMKWLKHITP